MLFNLVSENISNRPQIEFNDFVIVSIDSKKFVALVTDFIEEDSEAELSLMLPKIPSQNFTWPENLVTYVAPVSDILCSVIMNSLPENKYVHLC